MTIFSDQTKKAIQTLSRLPGLGPRQATRIVLSLINDGPASLLELISSLKDLSNFFICPRCFFIADQGSEFCRFCQDKGRRSDLIAVVERATDLISLEATHQFNGHYLVLGDLKKNGGLSQAQTTRLDSLKSRIKNELNGLSSEIIIATNPTAFGDASAVILSNELKSFTKKITRLGRGIPTGGEIEFADEDTLSAALENRH